MFDVMRYKTNFNTFFLKKLNKSNKFVSNDIVANNKFENL